MKSNTLSRKPAGLDGSKVEVNGMGFGLGWEEEGDCLGVWSSSWKSEIIAMVEFVRDEGTENLKNLGKASSKEFASRNSEQIRLKGF